MPNSYHMVICTGLSIDPFMPVALANMCCQQCHLFIFIYKDFVIKHIYWKITWRVVT